MYTQEKRGYHPFQLIHAEHYPLSSIWNSFKWNDTDYITYDDDIHIRYWVDLHGSYGYRDASCLEWIFPHRCSLGRDDPGESGVRYIPSSSATQDESQAGPDV